LARRSAVPVGLDLAVGRRLPESVEVAAYYVVAEALTNVAKYAQASAVKVCVDNDTDGLHLSIEDDGVGGADAANESGLIGLADRVEAIGGQMTISSNPAKRDVIARHNALRSPLSYAAVARLVLPDRPFRDAAPL
jgi:signal transduction histidine kinase